MNFEELLKDKPCSCGMTHTCSIKHILVEQGANDKLGGNDESVCVSDFPFICVDDYRDFPRLMQELL